ncbi:MAG TPA: hypothetical protein VMF58_08205 [Rhizomicrobium sp.]|nr:hypothetical protein [Rhizomicrobium sp.]
MRFWSYHFRLRKLLREQRRIDIHFHRSFPALKSADPAREVFMARFTEETLRNADAIEHLKSQWLLHNARKNDLPVPPLPGWGHRNDDWYSSPVTQSPILTERARADLRASIWDLDKQKWDRWSRWVPLLSGVTGLLGTIIGLIAAVSHWL